MVSVNDAQERGTQVPRVPCERVVRCETAGLRHAALVALEQFFFNHPYRLPNFAAVAEPKGSTVRKDNKC